MGIQCEDGCVFSHSEPETIDHVLLHCLFSRAIWFGSDLTMRANPEQIPSLKRWLVAWLLEYRGAAPTINIFPLSLPHCGAFGFIETKSSSKEKYQIQLKHY